MESLPLSLSKSERFKRIHNHRIHLLESSEFKEFPLLSKMIETILMLSSTTQNLISLPSSHINLVSFNTHTHLHTEIIKISEWIQIRNDGDPLIPMNHKPSPVQLIHQSITPHVYYSLINNIFRRKLSRLSAHRFATEMLLHLYNRRWVSISGKRGSLVS